MMIVESSAVANVILADSMFIILPCVTSRLISNVKLVCRRNLGNFLSIKLLVLFVLVNSNLSLPIQIMLIWL